MEKFVVKQLWLSGKGKKMYRSGAEVTRADFPENFDQLLREGRIAPAVESKPVKQYESIELNTGQESALDIVNNAMQQQPLFLIGDRKIFTIEDLNKKELIARLESLNIAHDPKDKKDVLWGVLLAS